MRRPVLAVLLLGVAVLLQACSPGEGAPADENGARPAAASRPSADLAGPAARAQAASQERSAELDESRRTAIVRAAHRVAPAVVSVNVIRQRQVRPRSIFEEFFLPPGASRRVPSLGSGFIFDERGYVLTNDHVVRGAERIMVTLPDGRDLETELVGTDQVTDVAVLWVAGEDLPVAPLGSSEGLMIGEWALAIGNPFGNLLSNAEPSVTTGVISAVGRHIVPSQEGQGFYLGMIQTDASINPGNSGGPLVNALGEVVGVNSSIFSRSGGSEGLGFAIPIDRAIRIADDLIAHGEVRRAWIGVDVEPVEADPWGRTRGVRVSRVAPESPAHVAGIGVGDRLIRANGRRLMAPLDYEAILLDLKSGDPVTLEVDGGDAVRMFATRLPSLQAERVTVLQEMELITVTPQVQAEQGVASEAGALIVDISANLSGQLGLREGDVIVQINNTRVRSADDAARIFESLSGQGGIRLYVERRGGILIRDFYWRR